MPSKVYRHPGGMREERAHLLSSSEAPDYNSGAEGSASAGVRAARNASLDLVAEMGDADANDDPFTDLTEDESLLNQKKS